MDISELDARSAARDEIPHEALGRTLQARLDYWALARDPGSLAFQVKSLPLSPWSVQPPTPSRVDSEAAREHLSPPKAAGTPRLHPEARSSSKQGTFELQVDPAHHFISTRLRDFQGAHFEFESTHLPFEGKPAPFEHLPNPR
ncbi:hypothetical protein PISMIDRAFT_19921 [Pisolithus microcarpus 441]|uniref:Uncharacterized protein n=1 Tax=Pisolithus microcarpus 441 TaxID=765257 RepID=A0A0C9XFB2_9AGAM|nr:hypothetical protein PISMIDRAFT_19921 [Pisolithus microcarpus 441]